MAMRLNGCRSNMSLRFDQFLLCCALALPVGWSPLLASKEPKLTEKNRGALRSAKGFSVSVRQTYECADNKAARPDIRLPFEELTSKLLAFVNVSASAAGAEGVVRISVSGRLIPVHYLEGKLYLASEYTGSVEFAKGRATYSRSFSGSQRGPGTIKSDMVSFWRRVAESAPLWDGFLPCLLRMMADLYGHGFLMEIAKNEELRSPILFPGREPGTLGDAAPNVRLAAIRLLNPKENPAVVVVLTSVLGSADSFVRSEAASALESAGWRPATDDQAIDFHFAKRQWGEMVRYGPAAVDRLLRTAAQDTWLEFFDLGELFKEMGTAAVPPLISKLAGVERYRGLEVTRTGPNAFKYVIPDGLTSEDTTQVSSILLAYKCLVRLTGRDFGLSHSRWQEWWNQQQRGQR